MKIVNAVLIGAASLFSSYVVAEACQITLSQPNVSFGRFKQGDIIASRKNWNRMPGKEVTATVFCPQPRVMALFLQSTSGSNGVRRADWRWLPAIFWSMVITIIWSGPLTGYCSPLRKPPRKKSF